MEWKSFKNEKPESNRSFLMGSFHHECVPALLIGDGLLEKRLEKDPNFWTHWIYIPEIPKTKKKYPAPKVGTIVTEENVDSFVDKFSHWLLLQGFKDGNYLSDPRTYVDVLDIRFRHNLPFHVKRVEDTDTVAWIQEDL